MNSDTQKTQEMTEFQVREAYTTLLREYQKLIEESGRFIRFIQAKDPSLLESFSAGALDQMIPAAKPNGQPRPPVTVTTRLIEGELHG